MPPRRRNLAYGGPSPESLTTCLAFHTWRPEPRHQVDSGGVTGAERMGAGGPWENRELLQLGAVAQLVRAADS
jgi:hypothetical protein